MKVGELVCLYRRKHKGMGIVLETQTISDEKIKIIEIAKNADWKQKEELKREALSGEKPQKGLIEAAFLYNLWQTNAKLKKDFVYIKWFQCPSEYVQTKTTIDADWFPVDWVGRIS
jgi:hypothetical protein|tara:strand:- start:317 stop:664 length:348 start_codon:yes stop_codon:yes gene_type:complete